MSCTYTFKHYKEILEIGKEQGYSFFTCKDYILRDIQHSNVLSCVLRHDVDLSPERAMNFAEIEHNLGIKSTYFFRVYANEYNLFSYEVLSLLRDLKKMGHEIGYHAEPIDVEKATGIPRMEAFDIGLKAMELALDETIDGIASHNDDTPDNNLEFFRNHSANSLGKLYEAYDNEKFNLFEKSTYVTDSYQWYWRTFINGNLTQRQDCVCKHFLEGTRSLYVLTHPHNWYIKHFHRVKY
ncbi:hypothetical protein COJ27_29885 [Bacillus cereus]|uniref:hypothetical protein n=1 Tax=Bacillus cereus TaxID=1396 RepID=UPI000BF6B79B|nr:hypothetical protein [Bacillus cereus]PFL57214.1 hypothetical protein COJ27_29885 [Bacillus cereus]